MCDPVTLAATSLAVSTVSTVASYVGQNSQAALERQAALQSTTDAYKQDDQQQILVQQQGWEKQNQAAIQAREAAATSATGAGEAGVSGTSVDALSRSYFAHEGQYDESVNLNTKADIDRLQLQQQGITDQGQGMLNRAVGPSPLSLVTGLAQGGLQSYGLYKQLSVPTSSTPSRGT